MTWFRNHTTAIRRGFITGVVLAMFGFALVYPHTGADGSTQEAAMAQPNIVVIMVDDMRKDDLAALPNTERLIGAADRFIGTDSKGATYNNAIVSLPLCCPSRATFLSGQYAHNHGVVENGPPQGGIEAFMGDKGENTALPVWLHNAGYRTSMLGKYLNKYGNGGTGVQYVPPGWTNWAGLTNPWLYRGFDVTIGSNETATPHTNGESITVSDGAYQSRWLGNRAVDQIGGWNGVTPEFMWLSFFAPHAAPTPDDDQGFVPVEAKYADTSQVGRPSSPAYDERVIGDKPPWIQKLPRLDDRMHNRMVQHRRERRDALKTVDEMVAKVVAAVQAKGLMDETLFIFTSDNGFMLGEHRITGGKLYPYLEALRVPLLMRGPGVTPGVNQLPVSNIDLAPTIAAVAGATPLNEVDGLDILANPPGPDRPRLIEYLWTDSPNGMPPYAGVWQQNMFYVEHGTDGGRGTETYNLDTDPWQQVNLDAGANAPERTRLAEVLDRLRHS